jgi:hypothetical protein
MRPTASLPPSRARLIALGVIQIVLGAFVSLCTLSTGMGMFMGYNEVLRRRPDAQAPIGIMVLPILFLVFSAVSLIVLGIGTILAKRWARSVTVVLSWIYLAIDLLAVGAALFGVLGGGSHVGRAEGLVVGFVLFFVALFAVGIPIVFLALYSSKRTKELFEALDVLRRDRNDSGP